MCEDVFHIIEHKNVEFSAGTVTNPHHLNLSLVQVGGIWKLRNYLYLAIES